MTAHVRLLDAGWRALAQDSIPYSLPGDHVVFRWELPPGIYWVEAWASNRAGRGCPTRWAYQVSNLPPDTQDPPPTAGAEIYELFDLSGRRLAKGRGEWKAEGLRAGIYWLRRTRGGQSVTRRVIVR
jgi:hypothetical protein